MFMTKLIITVISFFQNYKQIQPEQSSTSECQTNENTFFVTGPQDCKTGCLQIEHRMAGQDFPFALLNRQCLDMSHNARIDSTATFNNFCNSSETYNNDQLLTWLTPNSAGEVDYQFKDKIQLELFAAHFTNNEYWVRECSEGTGHVTVNKCYVSYEYMSTTQTVGQQIESISGLTSDDVTAIKLGLKKACVETQVCIQNEQLNLCDGISQEQDTIDRVCMWRFGMFTNCYANVSNINTQVEYNTMENITTVQHVKNGYEIMIGGL